MYNEEVWGELSELRKALKGLARETREALAEQEGEIAELRDQVQEMAKALAKAKALAVAA